MREFLSQHGIDFSLWMNRGIPYVYLEDANRMRSALAQATPPPFDQALLGNIEKDDFKTLTDMMAKIDIFTCETSDGAQKDEPPEDAPAAEEAVEEAPPQANNEAEAPGSCSSTGFVRKLKVPYFKHTSSLDILERYYAPKGLMKIKEKSSHARSNEYFLVVANNADGRKRIEEKVGFTSRL